MLQVRLQAVVPGPALVVPNPQDRVVRIQVPLAKSVPRAAKVINYRGSRRQSDSRQPVPLVRSQKVASLRADVIHFQNRLGQEFVLDAQQVIEDMWVAQGRGADDARQACGR